MSAASCGIPPRRNGCDALGSKLLRTKFGAIGVSGNTLQEDGAIAKLGAASAAATIEDLK